MNDFRTRDEKMPLLFVGHGNPMYAIEENEFTAGWNNIGKSIPRPEAILCISAHWETDGVFATAMERPNTIHDFYGFPKALFDVQYPAPGSPLLAEITRGEIKSTRAGMDLLWGLDHGTWAVLRNVYPEADIPVVQLSLAFNKNPQWHYDLARELSSLRNKGVLIIGSGNIVHNLRMADWRNNENVYDWAGEINEKIKNLILNEGHNEIINYKSLGSAAQLAAPTPEHFLPLLYTLGLKDKNEEVKFFNDKIVMGSMSMTSLTIGI
jgi:4,5-DOPA dioxygenase extradiol